MNDNQMVIDLLSEIRMIILGTGVMVVGAICAKLVFDFIKNL